MALKICKECKKEVSSKAKTCPNCGAPVPQNVGVGTIFVLLFVFYIFYAALSVDKPNHAAKTPKQQTLEQVKLLDFEWYKEGFGNVMEANFLISNESNHDIKDIEISCNHSGESGTKIDSNSRTIYEVIKSKQKKKVKKFNMGFIHSQAVKSSCKITNLELASQIFPLARF